MKQDQEEGGGCSRGGLGWKVRVMRRVIRRVKERKETVMSNRPGEVPHSLVKRGCFCDVAELSPFVATERAMRCAFVPLTIRSSTVFMLWQASIARIFPGRACTRIALRAASVVPCRPARFYSQHRSSDSGSTSHQGHSNYPEGGAQQPASHGSETSDKAAPETVKHPPKEELTPLAKHIRDSIKVSLRRLL